MFVNSKLPRTALINSRRRPARGHDRRCQFEVLEERTLFSAGDLDPTFGSSGVALGQYGVYSGYGVLQPDGKIVVGGTGSVGTYPTASSTFVLERLNGDGSVDPTFGTNGTVTTVFTDDRGRPVSEVMAALRIEADGKIVAASYGNGLDLVRYNQDGSLDPTFGNGGEVIDPSIPDGATDMILQPDGKILVLADGFNLYRFNADGSTDTTFGNGGEVTDTTQNVDALAIALQSNGDIVVAMGKNGSTGEIELARYTPSGTLDATFGTGGYTSAPFRDNAAYYLRLVIDPQDRPLLYGDIDEYDTSNVYFALMRFNADGGVDTTFGGGGGGVITGFGDSNSQIIAGVVVQPDGKIVAAGSTFGDFALARYNDDGSLDDTFGTSGEVLTPAPDGQAGGGSALLASDSRIIATGTSFNSHGQSRFMIARYLNDPFFVTGTAPDATLNLTGTSGDDQLSIQYENSDAPQRVDVTLNGVAKQYDSSQISGVSYDGLGGSDTATLFGQTGQVQLSAAPGQVNLYGNYINTFLVNSQANYVYLPAASDSSAALYGDGSQANTLAITEGYASMTSGNDVNFIAGAATLSGSAASTSDVAYFYSASGATLVGTPTYAYLSAGGVFASAIGFATTVGYSGGGDTAYFYGSAGVDAFVSTSTYAYMSGSAATGSYFNVFFGFASAYAYTGGGADIAYLYDDSGDRTFIGTGGYSYMAGSGFFQEAIGFGYVQAFSSPSENDSAFLYDSPGSNAFTGSGNQASLSSSSTTMEATGFAAVNAVQSQGTSDTKHVGAIDYALAFYGSWRAV